MRSKTQVSITLDKDTLKWLDEQVKQKAYANRSHAIEKIVWEKKK